MAHIGIMENKMQTTIQCLGVSGFRVLQFRVSDLVAFYRFFIGIACGRTDLQLSSV